MSNECPRDAMNKRKNPANKALELTRPHLVFRTWFWFIGPFVG